MKENLKMICLFFSFLLFFAGNQVNANEIKDISFIGNPTLYEAIKVVFQEEKIDFWLDDKNQSIQLDIEKIEKLNLAHKMLNDITQISSFKYLKELNLEENQIENIKPLASLSKLEYLNIGNNQVTDISPLAKLTNLKTLDLNGNPVEDVSTIEKLSNLDQVYMGEMNTIFTVKIKTIGPGRMAPSNELKIVKGRGKTLQMLPEEGYEVGKIMVDGVEAALAKEYTLTDVQHDSEIEVTFVKMEYWDVYQTDWFCDAVKFISSCKIMNGVDEVHFAPLNNTTRGMLVTVLYRLSAEEEKEFSGYVDVPQGAYYSHAVAWASKKGIVNGVGEGLFAPDNELTREQLVTILYRYAKAFGKSAGTYNKDNLRAYKDKSKVSNYAVEGFRWAVSEKIISGRSNNELAPQGTATRAEVATILQRFINK